MTLRRTIADALHRGADRVRDITIARARAWDREGSVTVDRLIRAEAVVSFAQSVRHLAALIDDPHAHPAAAERNDDARSNAPAPSAAVPVAEEAAVAAVADAKGGHEPNGTTRRSLRSVKGGRA